MCEGKTHWQVIKHYASEKSENVEFDRRQKNMRKKKPQHINVHLFLFYIIPAIFIVPLYF